VLNEGEGGSGAGTVERLLPPPESPEPPEPMPEAAPRLAERGTAEGTPEAGEAPLVAEAPEAPMPQVQEVPEVPAEDVPAETEAPEDTTSAPQSGQLADSGAVMALPQPKPAGGPPRDQIAELLEEAPVETADGAPSEAPLPAPGDTQTAALSAGDVVLQLASVKSEDAARTAWTRLQQAHPAELGNRALALDTAEVQGTTYYRVQTGPFPSRAAAADLCGRLKARNQDCLVTQR